MGMDSCFVLVARFGRLENMVTVITFDTVVLVARMLLQCLLGIECLVTILTLI